MTLRQWFFLGILGFSSGLPFMVTAMTLSARLTDAGLSLETLGFFALVGMPYAFKVLWAPLVSIVKIPFFYPWLGQLRAWAVVAQLGIMAMYVFMAGMGPEANLWVFAVLCLLLAFFSATQDVALDGYRIVWLEKDQQALGAGIFVNCYRIALLVSGAGAVVLSDAVGWPMVMLGLAIVQTVGFVAILMVPRHDRISEILPGSWVSRAFLQPLAGLMTHRGWMGFLLIVLTFRLPDAYLAAMNYRFLYDTGFSKAEIASVTQIYGLSAAFVGGIIGGFLVQKAGLYRALWVAALLQMLSNLSYAWIGAADLSVLIPVITLEEMTGGVATAAFLGFLALLCQRDYAAMQYALLTSLMAFTRMLVSATSGVAAIKLGWDGFFVLSAAMGCIGLGLVVIMRRPLKGLVGGLTRAAG